MLKKFKKCFALAGLVFALAFCTGGTAYAAVRMAEIPLYHHHSESCIGYEDEEVEADGDRVTYLLSEDGELTVTQEMTTEEGAKVSDMFRFGMVMQLPYDMDRSEFYGRGPVENYIDRKESQCLGIYKQTADEQFYPYVRPQETGLKSDVRWWWQRNGEGKGFKVVPERGDYLCMCALHYDIETLDEGKDKQQRHPSDLKKSEYTNLFIDSEHMGLACVNSWGAMPLPQHQVKYGNKKLTFVISTSDGQQLKALP